MKVRGGRNATGGLSETSVRRPRHGPTCGELPQGHVDGAGFLGQRLTLKVVRARLAAMGKLIPADHSVGPPLLNSIGTILMVLAVVQVKD